MTNGSHNDPYFPKRPLGYPHEGPFVAPFTTREQYWSRPDPCFQGKSNGFSLLSIYATKPLLSIYSPPRRSFTVTQVDRCPIFFFETFHCRLLSRWAAILAKGTPGPHRANKARLRQSRPNFGLVLSVIVLKNS